MSKTKCAAKVAGSALAVRPEARFDLYTAHALGGILAAQGSGVLEQPPDEAAWKATQFALSAMFYVDAEIERRARRSP